jgi:hypothetical protein
VMSEYLYAHILDYQLHHHLSSRPARASRASGSARWTAWRWAWAYAVCCPCWPVSARSWPLARQRG